MFAAVAGLPEAQFDVWCLVGRQAFFQIELFEFAKPQTRPIPVSWRPSDIGYSMFGVHVPDFDRTIETIKALGGDFISAPLGPRGHRRVCLKDPDGVLVEIMEDTPVPLRRADLPAIVSVTLSVGDLDCATDFWIDVMGCSDVLEPMHTVEHEALWGLAGARSDRVALVAGDCAIELARYHAPLGREKPAGYMLSDHGILNIAFGSTSPHEFDVVYRRALDHGLRGYTEPWCVPGLATVVYLTDPEGFSVELLYVEPDALERMGFVPDGGVRSGHATQSGDPGPTEKI
jgi:catechol 2,3-dioxygenase-like lactoylglutathione lyase family enzyme